LIESPLSPKAGLNSLHCSLKGGNGPFADAQEVHVDSNAEARGLSKAIHRRQFLGGDLSGQRRAFRPPWAVEESLFIERCDRCRECLSACPEGILIIGSGGFPEVDFSRGGCTFCEECLHVCKPLALEAGDSPWRIKAEILPNCLSLNAVVCRSCGEACEEEAIRFRLERGGVARPVIDLGQCNGCGECYGVCPVKSVRMASET